MNEWQGSMSEKIWKKFKFDAKNNIKTPLGLISLMINIEHADTLDKQQDDAGMEMKNTKREHWKKKQREL